jgi:hypothetical protein
MPAMLTSAAGVLAVLSMAAANAAAPAKNAHLASAEAQVGALQYSEAAKSLAHARVDQGNDRATLIRILELTGVVEASLGHGQAANDAFSEMLYLDPTHGLSDEWGPKVKTPFYEARGWMGDHHPFSAKAVAPKLEGGKAKAVSVELGEDPLHVFSLVRVHFTADGAARTADAPAAPGVVSIPAPSATKLTWWAEVVGKNAEVFGTVGDASSPQVIESAPKPAPAVALATPPTVSAPPTVAATAGPELEPQYRPAAYGLMGGGVAALVVGAICGVMVKSDQSELNNAARNQYGQITGLTQAKAFSLNSSAEADGIVADIGFVVGGLALASGAALWFYGGQVAVAPTAGGVTVAAAF